MNAAAVPTMAAAEAAAAELAAAGVARVLLFGSLARGEQQASDIDMVAIFDDLDYRERRARRCELVRRAEDASGCDVDLLVTDAPEWAVRTKRVPCSLEAHIATYATLLIDSGAHAGIDWDKEIGLPDNATAEVQARHHDMSTAVSRLVQALRVSVEEIDAVDDGDPGAFAAEEQARFAAACSHAHLVVECAAKTMIALSTNAAPPREHDIDKLIARLPADERDRWEEFTASVDTAELHLWRQGGTYVEDLPVAEFDDQLLCSLADAAADLAAHVTERCDAAGIDREQVRVARRRERRLDRSIHGPVRLDDNHPIRRSP